MDRFSVGSATCVAALPAFFFAYPVSARHLPPQTGAKPAPHKAPVAAPVSKKPLPTPLLDPGLAAKLVAMEKAIEEKRVALGIPGMSLAVVQNDRVIYAKGFGWRDVAQRKPVTPDTLFAIGSSTKAFTALSLVMAQEDRKLQLSDAPRKYVPYFKLKDPAADAKITLRDLLSHNSGLPRTDISWIAGKLTREQAIRVLADVTPTAPFGTKWQYQNVMFATAGEAVGRAEHTTYENFLQTRLLKPLGMTATTLSVKEMQKRPDYAVGYDLTPKNPGSRPLPMRDLPAIAPAGAINSSARDMTRWLRLLLNEGTVDGKRLVSTAGLREVMTKRMTVAGSMGYALGWFVRDWNGHKVVEHGGNIDGFNAEVALMPDRKLGFVLLTNVSASPLGETALDAVWSNLVGAPKPAETAGGNGASTTVAPDAEAGKYAAPGIVADVKYSDGKLTLTVPGQPTYPLTPVAGRRYKLGNPAPDGFFVTFRPVQDKPGQVEAYLEQPQGNMALSRLVATPDDELKTLREAVGEYAGQEVPALSVAEKEGGISLTLPGQPSFPLRSKTKDVLYSPGLPEGYAVLLRRDATQKVVGITLKQPNGEFALNKKGEITPFIAPLTTDELVAKMIEAVGGEAALRRHTSLETTGKMVLENQGLTGTVHAWAKAPDLEASETALLALGKVEVGRIRDTFDGNKPESRVSFQPPGDEPGADEIAAARQRSRFRPLLELKTLYKDITITGKDTVEREPVYVVRFTPQTGEPVVNFVSEKTFLILRRETRVPLPAAMGGSALPVVETFRDWRDVDGEKVAFRTTSKSPNMGLTTTTIIRATFNVPIGAERFRSTPAGKTAPVPAATVPPATKF